jgi:hypothetical protein
MQAVTIAEIIKRRVPGLHQNTSIGSLDITDTYEPIEVGLDKYCFFFFFLNYSACTVTATAT